MRGSKATWKSDTAEPQTEGQHRPKEPILIRASVCCDIHHSSLPHSCLLLSHLNDQDGPASQRHRGTPVRILVDTMAQRPQTLASVPPGNLAAAGTAPGHTQQQQHQPPPIHQPSFQNMNTTPPASGSKSTHPKKRKGIDRESVGPGMDMSTDDDAGSVGQPSGGKDGKRTRVHFSCVECHRRKQKCDRKEPCSQCVARKVPHLCRPFLNGVEDPNG